MNKKIADKWVKALRSGKYKQGQYMLEYVDNKSTKYCCLGVLCDLYQKEQKAKKKKTLKSKLSSNCDYKYDCVVYGKDNYNHLPHTVQKWAGMKDEVGEFELSDEETEGYSSLAELNDQACYNFKRIATFIEKNYDVL